MAQGIERITNEHIAGPVVDRADASSRVKDGERLARLMQYPAFRRMLTRWRDLSRASTGELLGTAPAELAEKQALRRGFLLPEQIVEETLQLAAEGKALLVQAAESARFERENAELYATPPEAVELDAFDEKGAQTACEAADEVTEMVADPGWAALMRDLAAATRAHCRMLAYCTSEDATMHRAMIAAVRMTLAELDQELTRGLEAAEWQKRRDTEQEENGNA